MRTYLINSARKTKKIINNFSNDGPGDNYSRMRLTTPSSTGSELNQGWEGLVQASCETSSPSPPSSYGCITVFQIFYHNVAIVIAHQINTLSHQLL